jgi:3D (Asp-Asp-Asp) domain-containing protein
VTASGVAPKFGVAAADPSVLPVGSVVQIDGVPERHRGIYTVLDTGPKVLGRHLDLYIWSCNEALEFGRRPVSVTVLRFGWSPSPKKAN